MTKLKALRMARGVSQTQLARDLGVTPLTLSRCENGWFARPPRGLLDKLRAYYGPEWSWDKFIAPAPEPTAKVR